MGPLLVVFVVMPLSQRLRRSGKPFTKDQLIGRLAEVTGAVVALLIIIGIMWGLGLVFEHWHEGWGWIGGLFGSLVAVGAIIAWVVVSEGRGAKRKYERAILITYQYVVEKPGISHTALLRSVEPSYFATDVLHELLREKRIKLERRGRVRRYFA